MSYNIQKVKYNQTDMMRIRGYTIPAEEMGFLENPTGQIPPLNTYYAHTTTSPAVVVYIPTNRTVERVPGTVSKEDIATYIGPSVNVVGTELHHLILVSDPISNAADTELLSMINEQVVRIERFSYEFFMVRPDKHRMTPPFRVLTQREVSEFLTLERNTTRYPRIASQRDPLARFLGLRKGQMIETVIDKGLGGPATLEHRVVF